MLPTRKEREKFVSICVCKHLFFEAQPNSMLIQSTEVVYIDVKDSMHDDCPRVGQSGDLRAHSYIMLWFPSLVSDVSSAY